MALGERKLLKRIVALERQNKSLRHYIHEGGDFIPKKGPEVDVRAYGAVANGVTRADDNIQAAIDAMFNAGGGIVKAPAAGVGARFFRMEAPLDWKPGVSIHGASAEMGTVDGTVYRGAVFRAHGKFPIIRNWQAGAGEPPNYSSLKNLILEYDNLSGIWDGYSLPAPGAVSPSTTPVGIFIGANNVPHGLIFENVRVLNAGYGLFMEGGSFLNTFNRLDVNACRVGIYCEGSAAGFWGCESRGLKSTARDGLVPDPPWDKQAWVLSGMNYVLDYCDAEDFLSSTNPVVDIDNCLTLTINGLSIEGMTFDGASCVRIQSCPNATINGLTFVDGLNTMESGGTRYLFINDSKVLLSGARIGYDTFPVAGSRYGLYIEGSQVAVRASSLHDAGQGNVFAVGITGTRLTFDASAWSSLYDPNTVLATTLQS